MQKSFHSSDYFIRADSQKPDQMKEWPSNQNEDDRDNDNEKILQTYTKVPRML